ncbi:MAG: PASTA domain-containing protein, partial [Deltaproteobacteria bacterium]
MPDLVGMKLSKALEILDSLGVKDVDVIVTSPPKEEKIANKD